MKIYAAIAWALDRRDSNVNVPESLRTRAAERLHDIISNHLPHGSGFDGATAIHHDGDPRQHYTIASSYHKMDEHGGYDGWADFEIHVVAKPDLLFSWDVEIEISNAEDDLRNYILDTFYEVLNQEFPL